MTLKQFFPLLFTLLLSGCGVYNSQFDCKSASGMKCKSMSDINQVIEKEEERGVVSEAKAEIIQLQPFPKQTHHLVIEQDRTVIRLPEETMRVWIAPYKNKSDEYVEAFYMHLVTKASQWVNR